MSEEIVFSDPVLEGITIELRPELKEDPLHVAASLLDKAAHAMSLDSTKLSGWTQSLAFKDPPVAVDCLPPDGHEMSIQEAWDLCHELRAQPEISDAEPSFELFSDNFPDDDDLASSDEYFQRLARMDEAAETEDTNPVSRDLPVVDPGDPFWNPLFIRAPEAWKLAEGGGKGIRVGHPDSGYRRHREIWEEPNRILTDLEYDFIDSDEHAEDDHGDHGLGTASVLMSGDNRDTQPASITGIAPEVEILPLRVAKKRFFKPAPVLLRKGMIRLRKAVNCAVQSGCDVISISLGGLWNKSLERALKAAARSNVIVCAAAGNYVRVVVWPARYGETIAVAGCTARGKKWWGSSRGSTVDVTAPAKKVWKAKINRKGDQVITQTRGTSFAAASTAGIAALWLARWKEEALAVSGKDFHLLTIFRRILGDACEDPPPGDGGKFGRGIVNAYETLRLKPPALDALHASTAPLQEVLLATPPASSTGGVDKVLEVFDIVPRPILRARLAQLLNVSVNNLSQACAGLGDELAFHLLTTPSLRDALIDDRTWATGAQFSTFRGLKGLSSRLRSRIGP